MFKELIKQQWNIKSILSLSIFFLVYILIYTLLDYFNGGYRNMSLHYGIYLPIINIIINILMSLMSAFMMNLSTTLVKQSGKEGKGAFLSFLSVLFGILTYGCTSCVITFFATIGITFSVAILPLAGLPYKLVSLIIIIIGFMWMVYEVNHSKCHRKEVKS